MRHPEDNVQHRLSVLDLAQALGNVSEACRREGISRTQFYEYKQRFQELGLEGLKNTPQVRKAHSGKTSPEIVDQILKLSLEHPGWGCIRLSESLKTHGINISSPTVQNILIKHNMGSKHERVLELEEKALRQSSELSDEQIALISKTNPCFLEREHRSGRPGELLSQDTIYIGYLSKFGKIYLQAVVDTFGSYAFGFIHQHKIPDCAVALLHNDVLPFYQKHKLTVSGIITNNSHEYRGKPNHHYELYLMLNDIEHRYTKVRKSESNGFVRRFSKIVLAEFFKKAFYKKLYIAIEDLQTDFDKWLFVYNHRRPHHGYPNMGRCPNDIISEYLNTHKNDNNG